jgi:hypothetical protein
VKPRLNIHVSHDLHDRVCLAARKPGVTKAAIIEAALTRFFERSREAEDGGVLVRRLDRLSRHLDRLERDQTIIAETLALHIQFYLTVTPTVAGPDQEAARALGRERFDYFLERLARRLATNRTVIARLTAELRAGRTAENGEGIHD